MTKIYHQSVLLQETIDALRVQKGEKYIDATLGGGGHTGEILRLGEEVFAKRIASAILKEREYGPITTTTQLAKVIASVIPGKNHTVHPATKSFQALRIAVNDELYVLDHALPQALSLLTHNGRLVVISFHSLEARIVKRTFIEWEKKGLGKMITDTPITQQLQEIEENKRSRSSQLRVFEKI